MSFKKRLAGVIIIVITLIAFSGLVGIMIAPREKNAEMWGIKLSHIEETDGRADRPHLVLVKAVSEAGDSLTVKVHYYRGGEFHTLKMQRLMGTNYYGVEIPGDKLGQRNYYYIEALSSSGSRVVLPKSADDSFDSEYDYFKIRYEGQATFILLLLHIVLMMAALLLLIHALYYALNYLYTGEREEAIVRSVNLGTLIFFITGFPIGWIIEKQVLGNYWEGIPFGWDITDSKTLIILVLWLVFIILKWRGKISSRLYARWVIISTIITIGLFLLPHSI